MSFKIIKDYSRTCFYKKCMNFYVKKFWSFFYLTVIFENNHAILFLIEKVTFYAIKVWDILWTWYFVDLLFKSIVYSTFSKVDLHENVKRRPCKNCLMKSCKKLFDETMQKQFDGILRITFWSHRVFIVSWSNIDNPF